MEMIFLQASGQAGTGSGFSTIIMMVAIFVIFWLFMIRPQQKRQKELQKKREALSVNDRIVSSGGLYGVIKDIKETEFVVEIAEGVRVRMDKGSVFPASPLHEDGVEVESSLPSSSSSFSRLHSGSCRASSVALPTRYVSP